MGVNLRDTLPPILQARGMTQDALADATGIRRTDINKIARGRVEVGPSRLQRIADALGVTVLELAPQVEPDERGLLFLDRLEALEEREANDVLKLRRDLAAAIRRIRALERQSQVESTPVVKKNGKRR